MRYFFVDTENVQQYNFIEDMELNSNDKIIMFMSEKSQNIKPTDLRRFTKCKASIEYEDVAIGKTNALDFQLIANISMTVASNIASDIEYFIVSNDKDYELPIGYILNKTGVKIKIIKTYGNEIATTIENLNSDNCTKLDLEEEAMKIVNQSHDLQTLHNDLRTKYGQTIGRDLYMKIRPHFKNLKTKKL